MTMLTFRCAVDATVYFTVEAQDAASAAKKARKFCEANEMHVPLRYALADTTRTTDPRLYMENVDEIRVGTGRRDA